jgi:hypothetical protein
MHKSKRLRLGLICPLTVRELQPKPSRVSQEGSADPERFVGVDMPASYGVGLDFPLLPEGCRFESYLRSHSFVAVSSLFQPNRHSHPGDFPGSPLEFRG